VIKVERPGHGDDTRKWGPPFLKDRDGRDTADAAYYLACNRGKKSITLDLAHARGRELARTLALKSDVLVENFKVGDLARHGLDYASLAGDNPRLVYCSITGFGQAGPYSDRPGYDFMVQGLGGLLSVTGERDDLPGGGGPRRWGVGSRSSPYATGDPRRAMLGAREERQGTGDRPGAARRAGGDATEAQYFVSNVAPERAGNAH
jgi:crotonobetainyl-CoA:carnitine CoA-transferase CaiB-like acyl-CoA transferase